jgi:hypothetical protein
MKMNFMFHLHWLGCPGLILACRIGECHYKNIHAGSLQAAGPMPSISLRILQAGVIRMKLYLMEIDIGAPILVDGSRATPGIGRAHCRCELCPISAE